MRIIRRLFDFSPALLALLVLVGIGGLFYAAAEAVRGLMPPPTLSFAAGRPGGAYYGAAEQYRAILARDDIRVEILETAGSTENLQLLVEGGADVALLQGGLEIPQGAELEALAAVFLEPFFIFHRADMENADDPSTWPGVRVAAGEPGSGARAALDRVIEALALPIAEEDLLPLSGRAAADALLSGQVDVAVFVAPVDAPYLQPLLRAPELRIASIRDSEALARQLPFVRMVDIPPSGIDFAARLPPERVPLTAMVGALVARDNLHPALVNRLVRAAEDVHDGPNLLSLEIRFPSTEGLDLPVNGQAAAALASGPGLLERVLPYWMAAQIAQVALFIVPVIVVSLPLLRSMPGLYAWRMRARIYRRYNELVAIDAESRQGLTPTRRAELLEALETIDREAVRLRVPASYRSQAYALRLHVDLVRKRLQAEESGEPAPVSGA